jgi:hypothetical protein
LAATDIPLDAWVLAVADAFDAMTSDRSYRPALSHDEAKLRLAAGAGIQFDPAVPASVPALELDSGAAAPAAAILDLPPAPRRRPPLAA